MQINNSLVIISGGASGAGRAVATHLASLGATVGLLDINGDEAEKLAGELKGVGKFCDVTSGSQVEQAIQEITQAVNLPLRANINCAGIAPPKRIVGKEGPAPLEFFEKVINVNLIGTYNVMRIAAGFMTKTDALDNGERGVIINTASIAAFEGQIGQAAYSASKGGVAAMTLPAAREFARFGVRVMTIAPGLLDTPMLQGLPKDARETLEAQTPFPPRFGRTEEFASLTQHILENTFLNGEIIRLDGALRMPAV